MDTDPVATQLRFPDLSEGARPLTVTYGYDKEGDRLWISFVDKPIPAYSFVVDDYIAVRIDLETNEVVGIEFERFTARAVAKHPELIPLLPITTGAQRKLKMRKKQRASETEAVRAIVGRLTPALA